jgi:hypothetical protein
MSEDVTDGEGGSSKVFLVLGLIVGLGLGAGGGFYYFGAGGGDGEVAEDGSPSEENREPVIPIAFDRLAVPIYATRGNSRRYIGNYFVDLHVNVRGADNQIAVKRSMSQLQHAFVSAISRAELMREESPTELDIDKAADLLEAKANEVLGTGIIDSVTISKSMRVSN